MTWTSDAGPRSAPPLLCAFFGLLVFVGMVVLMVRAYEAQERASDRLNQPRVERLREALAPMTEQ